MSKHTISIGRILGIPVGVDPSWFLIFALLTWMLAASYFPAEFHGWSTAQYWVVGAVTSLMLFGSVILHELGHSVVALRYKIPVKSITLFVFGGVAQLGAEPPSAASEFWIAIAGPVVSFGLGAIFALLAPLAGRAAPVLAVCRYLAYINGTLGLFNLVPGFPLDGGRVLRAIIWGVTKSLQRATLIAGTVGRVIAFSMILIGVWFMLAGNLANGIWIAFIGWFLDSAAVSQLQAQRVQGLLSGRRVVQAMRGSCVTVPAEASIQSLVDQHILGTGQRCLVVQSGQETVGLVTPHNIQAVPRDQWAMTTAAQVMIPMDRVRHLQSSAPLTSAMQAMDRDGVNQLPVFDDGRLVGILSRDDMITYLRTIEELS